MPEIVFLHASAGQGHQKIAEAAREGFLAEGIPSEKMFLLDALDRTPSWFKKLYTGLYFNAVKNTPRLWGWSYKISDNPVLYQGLIRYLRQGVNDWIGKGLILEIKERNPAVVISTHFLAPEILGRMKSRGEITSLLITVITDFKPQSFWVNPGTDYYWVMSEEGREDLIRRGVKAERIVAGGIPVSLKFRPGGRKNEIRKKEGLNEKKFTILVTSGSFGLGPTLPILEALNEFKDTIQVAVVCGRNEEMKSLLEKKNYSFSRKIFGFVSNMDELMEASDLLIAKPGGATAAESLAKQIPMVVLDPIPGQETGNAHLLKERNAAFFLGVPRDIRTILRGILDYPEMLGEKGRSLGRLSKPEAARELARFALERIQEVKK